MFVFVRRKPIEGRVLFVPIVRPAQQHYGDETIMASPCAMRADFTINYTMWIGRRAWKKMAFKRENASRNIHCNRNQNRHQLTVINSNAFLKFDWVNFRKFLLFRSGFRENVAATVSITNSHSTRHENSDHASASPITFAKSVDDACTIAIPASFARVASECAPAARIRQWTLYQRCINTSNSFAACKQFESSH